MLHINSKKNNSINKPFPNIYGRNRGPSIGGNILVFLLPIIGLVKINLIGELYVHELLLTLLLPILLMKRGNLLSEKIIKSILLMGFLWLLSQVLTDLIRETPAEDFLRGWAKISFFMISFMAMVMLLTTPFRIFLFLSASTIPLFFRPFQLFEDYFELNLLWKFGVGPALLLGLCLPFLWRLFRDPQAVTPIYFLALLHMIIGAVSFFLNARSGAAIAILTSFFLLIYIRYRGIYIKTRQVFLGIIFFLISAYVVSLIYSTGASSGFFGEDAKNKYEIQMSDKSNFVYLLLGGRSESLVSTVAISDSPIIGHGSWAKNYKYTDLLRSLKIEKGINLYSIDDYSDRDKGLIPSHSFLLGSWVEAGLLGAVFWSYITYILLFKLVPVIFAQVSPISVYLLMLLLSFIWNIFFSPFAASYRFDVGGLLAIISIVLVTNQYSTQIPKLRTFSLEPRT